MSDTRTIDNLGLDSSVRFAKDQEYLDRTFAKESPFVSKQTTFDVSTPSFLSRFDALFQLRRQHPHWALFEPPKGFTTQKARLFTFQAIPSLGSEELKQVMRERIEGHVKAKREREKNKPDTAQNTKRDEQESTSLLDLLDYLQMVDELLDFINSRRSQYSKG